MRVIYVLGFYFSTNLQQIALITKSKPAWQAGMLNGIGGRVENHETSLVAMQREFKEETGVTHAPWKEFCNMIGGGFVVHCFAGIGEPEDCKSPEMEPVAVYDSLIYAGQRAKQSGAEIYVPIIPNLSWLIPLAQDSIRGGPDHTNVSY